MEENRFDGDMLENILSKYCASVHFDNNVFWQIESFTETLIINSIISIELAYFAH